MAKKLSNVETYIGLLFIFAILSIGIGYLGKDALENNNANLDNDSVSYIAKLNGVDNSRLNDAVSAYRSNKTEKEQSISISGNGTQGNPKDEGLEFLYTKEKAFNIELTIKRVFGLPKFILVDLLRFDVGDWEWLINIVGWLLTISIIIAIVFYIRGVSR